MERWRHHEQVRTTCPDDSREPEKTPLSNPSASRSVGSSKTDFPNQFSSCWQTLTDHSADSNSLQIYVLWGWILAYRGRSRLAFRRQCWPWTASWEWIESFHPRRTNLRDFLDSCCVGCGSSCEGLTKNWIHLLKILPDCGSQGFQHSVYAWGWSEGVLETISTLHRMLQLIHHPVNFFKWFAFILILTSTHWLWNDSLMVCIIITLL